MGKEFKKINMKKINESISSYHNIEIDSDITLGENIEIRDFLQIFNFDGKISGYSGRVLVKDLYTEIIEKISLMELIEAQAIACVYIVNEEISMYALCDVMERLRDIIDDSQNNVKMIFRVYTSKDLNVEEIGYRILLTGLKNHVEDIEQILKKLNNQNLDLRFHKQLYNDNHELKMKIEKDKQHIQTLENKINTKFC